MTRPSLFAIGLLAAAPAAAHPGHEAAVPGHWLSDLSHLAVVAALAALAALVIGTAIARRRHRQRPRQG
jgi:hypothetical protein